VTDGSGLDQAEREAAAEAREESGLPPADDEPTPVSSAEYSTAFSPRNVAVGLAIVAGLIAFAASRRRRRPNVPDA
jgi:hypothetical protein